MTSQAIIRDVCVASGPLPDSLTSWSGDVASQPWSRAPSGDRPPACRPFRSIYSSGHGWCPQEEARPAVRAGDPGLGLAPTPPTAHCWDVQSGPSRAKNWRRGLLEGCLRVLTVQTSLSVAGVLLPTSDRRLPCCSFRTSRNRQFRHARASFLQPGNAGLSSVPGAVRPVLCP